MALPSELTRKEFVLEHDVIKEEARLLKQRVKFIQDKIKKCEKEKKNLLAKIREGLATMNYEEVKKELENQLLTIVERRELPWSKIFMSVVYNRIANMQQLVQNRDPNSILNGTTELINMYSRLQTIMQVRIADLEDEVARIRDAIAKGIPLLDLYQIQEDERKEANVDIQTADLESNLQKQLHTMQSNVVGQIVQMQRDFEKFEKEHGAVHRLHEVGAHVMEFHERIGKGLAGVDIGIMLVETAVNFSPIGHEVLSAFDLGKGIFTGIVRNDELLGIMSTLNEVEGKWASMMDIPGFDKVYAQRYLAVRQKYKDMILASVAREKKFEEGKLAA